ncbi:MAG: hypothetical protein A4E46_00741 [Methanosaeta sp. PtaU1.Bin016]|nr:MAG: hypothetical protein A4E46_00741 [Methanosaeta sp. PtaU1.Bin016]
MSKITYYSWARDNLRKDHPRIYGMLLIIALLSLAGMAAFLVFDILSFGSDSTHRGTLANYLQSATEAGARYVNFPGSTSDALSANLFVKGKNQSQKASNSSREANGSVHLNASSSAKASLSNSSTSSRTVAPSSSNQASKANVGIRVSSGGGSHKSRSKDALQINVNKTLGSISSATNISSATVASDSTKDDSTKVLAFSSKVTTNEVDSVLTRRLNFKTDSVASADKQNSEKLQRTSSEAKTRSITSSYTSKGQTDLKTARNQQVADRNKLISDLKRKAATSRANQVTRQPSR